MAPEPLDRAAASGAELTIDLDAIAWNYALLRARVSETGGACGGVVKADGYGLGAGIVARRLAREGCRDFFVAHLAEGAAIKPALPADARIYVMHGAMPGAEPDLARLGLIPALNSPEQLAAWSRQARQAGRELPALLQVDTGMSRMGFSPEEARQVAADPDKLSGVRLDYVMSHLACADDPSDPTNARQLAVFNQLRAVFPGVPGTLANSSGVFLGADYHADLARPGAALYGVAPVTGAPNPMRAVAHLTAKIVNIRTIPAGAGVGYGMTFRAAADTRVATIAIGYADGFLRSLSNSGAAFAHDVRLPIVGRVSMDSVGVDISALSPGRLAIGDTVELLGPNQGVDDLANAAGTIGYEILTSLGLRFHRIYRGDAQDGAAATTEPELETQNADR